MEKERIHWWDFQRILFGQAPPEFLLEVFIRSFILYMLALIVMRWLGKRMNGQLSIIEIAVMIMMGATIGAPMQIPDRGILQGLVILVTMLFLLRSVNLVAYKRSSVEQKLNGKVSVLVKDGVLQTDAMHKDRISKPQLYAELRTNGIFNLGRVKRVYLEPYGSFSIYKQNEATPGLLLYPDTNDKDLPAHRPIEGALVCNHCGTIVHSNNDKQACSNCNHVKWEKPILEE